MKTILQGFDPQTNSRIACRQLSGRACFVRKCGESFFYLSAEKDRSAIGVQRVPGLQSVFLPVPPEICLRE
jgi:hypothetical protein